MNKSYPGKKPKARSRKPGPSKTFPRWIEIKAIQDAGAVFVTKTGSAYRDGLVYSALRAMGEARNLGSLTKDQAQDLLACCWELLSCVRIGPRTLTSMADALLKRRDQNLD